MGRTNMVLIQAFVEFVHEILARMTNTCMFAGCQRQHVHNLVVLIRAGCFYLSNTQRAGGIHCIKTLF